MDIDDTIVAIASPTAPAPRGIVRMSGVDVVPILHRLKIEFDLIQRPSRFESTVDLGDPIGEVAVSVMLWPGLRSYTGQPSCEFHTIGSLPILRGLTDRAVEAGARAARPGEFTMRAFLAGQLDLTQAEAVLGVIEAQGRGSLDHALAQLSGNLSKPLEQLRAILLDLLADVEAGLDFVDEDIEFIDDGVLVERLGSVMQDLERISANLRQRGGGHARPMVTLRGLPNAGKSCLMNRLGGRQIAIVADLAGTTRDAVSGEAMIGEQAVTLLDTAGIEDIDSEVSRLSQRQADRAAAGARIRLWCVDSSSDDFVQTCESTRRAASATASPSMIDLWIATKADSFIGGTLPAGWLACSAISGDGIDELTAAISSALQMRDAEETGSIIGTAARCSQSIGQAIAAIENAISTTLNSSGHEFVSAELRTAVEALGEVTGAVYTDDILDRVFSRFCIGK